MDKVCLHDPPPENSTKAALIAGCRGFTLIELSMVLVIIGLLVGGVLVGQDLIKAAQVRATVTQLERYNTAANMFQAKYNALPGDISDPAASSFGFQPRGTLPGQGDGNGVLQARDANNNLSGNVTTGEIAMFWVDLSTAGYINDTFNTATATATKPSSSNQALYFPAAAIGQGNYIYIWSGWSNVQAPLTNVNLFGLALVSGVSTQYSNIGATNGLTVQQGYSIDTKIDDGQPMTGKVQAMYNNGGCEWANIAGYGAGTMSCNFSQANCSAASATSSSCMDNGNSGGAQMNYSTSKNTGNLNCALSFQMQGAAR
jgi:prepilin-type N-terminal cleavage/methylation domain-containing protein